MAGVTGAGNVVDNAVDNAVDNVVEAAGMAGRVAVDRGLGIEGLGIEGLGIEGLGGGGFRADGFRVDGFGSDGGRRDDRADRDVREGPDEVERVLLKARELIESSMSEHRRRAAQAPTAAVECLESRYLLNPRRMIERARRSVSVALGVGDGVPPEILSLVGEVPSAARAGVVFRLLCGPRALHEPAVRKAVRRSAGWAVRLVPTPLCGTVIIDGRLALTASGPAASGRISVVREPTAVRAMELLFAGAWAAAEPLGGAAYASERVRTHSALRILEHLRAGRTDDTAAQELGVSVRTYRRHVADLMRELGATSRFQAGARAVELGLLA